MITITIDKAVTDKLVFNAESGGDALGTVVSRIDDGTLYIEKIDGEIFLTDGLCRAVMNYACTRGILRCVIENQDSAVQSELTRLGFVQNGNNVIDDIDNFFTTHKSCRK